MIPTDVIFAYGDIDDTEIEEGFRDSVGLESFIRRMLRHSGDFNSENRGSYYLDTFPYGGFVVAAAWTQTGEVAEVFAIRVRPPWGWLSDPFEEPDD